MTHTSRNDDHLASPYQIALSNQQSRHPVDEAQLTEAAAAVLRDSAFSSAAISLAVVDDEMMHELNRRHLEHDWPTDVLSFVLENDGNHLEGEVILSADTAAAAAGEHGHSDAEEQLLYVIHGMLHLVGYDDKGDNNAQEMRAAECRYLQKFGVELARRVAP
jgi:probable rRNA maturation factor